MSRLRTDRLKARQVLSHLSVFLVVSAVLGVVVSGLAIPFAGVLGLGARNASNSLDDLPQELETESLPQRTQILDANGDTIATVYDENRVNVDLDQVSRIMVKAIVSIEDYRFYQHGALDLKGTLRAFVTNQAGGGVVQGGSSITQQMVKLTLQNQADTKAEREAATADSYARKLNELRYAIAVEENHSKDWILERYLNIAYFGDGAYGIQAAAQHYFRVNARELDLPQSAMLAGLVQNPSGFDPTNSPERATERRNVVLDRMAELNVISQKKAERTKKQDLGLDPLPTPNGCVSSAAPWFCDYVISYLKKDPALGDRPAQRLRLIKSGGLTINTTIDLRMQRAADAAVADHVYALDNAVGALALVEPRTGEVKALAQSRPLGINRDEGDTFLNYTVPEEYGKANGFQPGSTFKAFVLAAAVNQGIPLTQTFPAPAEAFIPESDFETCDGPYPSSGVWTPENSTSGPSNPNLYQGTQLSINTFFANLEVATGICEPYTLAKDMGISLTSPDTEQVPSFTLGVADVSPLEMAEAYATFAGRGLHCDSRPVNSILDSDGNTFKNYEPQCTQVVPTATADAVNDVLQGVTAPGGFGSALAPPQPSAGKTGTTNDNKAVWFVGYTPNLAGAATVAGANEFGQPITLNGQSVGPGTIASAFGSTVAGPIWGQAYGAIAPFLPDASFTDPVSSDVTTSGETVPSVNGQTVDEATATLEGAGFTVTVGGFVDSDLQRGLISYTSPAAGDSASEGDSITIYPSDGTA